MGAATPINRRPAWTLLGGGRARSWLDPLVVVWLIWLFDLINNLAPVRQGLAVGHGQQLLSLERSLDLAPELTLNKWLSAHLLLSQIVVFWYENVHIVVTLLVFAWIWWRRPDLLPRMRLTLIAVNLIALTIFWSFPVAPPRMLHGGYVDLVARVQHLPVWRFGAVALHSNQLCSFPSLHIAWAVWSSIGLWRVCKRRWVRIATVIYPFITTFAVMATANHFLADCVLGALITTVCAGAIELPRVLSTGAPGRVERSSP
jgi:hypothetical protein